MPGATLLVRDGGSTNKVAFGVAETTTKAQLKVDDRFRIGSLAKTYVSVVVLQLVDEKKLGLDDSIEKFVPGMVPVRADASPVRARWAAGGSRERAVILRFGGPNVG